MTGRGQAVVRGLVAGAVGTVALNATTYADMAVRKRPPSSTPEQVAAILARLLHVPLPGDAAARQARLTGLGAVLGTAAGVSAGALLGLLRPWTLDRPTGLTAAWVLAMLVGNGPMTVLGVTDPRTWSRADWLADVVPHLAYAVAAETTLEIFEAT